MDNSSSASASAKQTSTTAAAVLSVHPLKEQFLACPGDPVLRWEVWYQMFQDHLVGCGAEHLPENRRLALLRSSLGTEGYRICSELCPNDLSFDQTVTRLANRFAPKQSRIYSRAQFNRRLQHSHENCLQFSTELRTLVAKCSYADDITNELVRDRFVAGLSNDRIRERLFLEKDDLSMDDALNLALNFERATTESRQVTSSTSSTASTTKVQALSHRRPSMRQNQSPYRRPSQSSTRSSSKGTSSFRNEGNFKNAHKPLPNMQNKCYRCGNARHSNQQRCPAIGVTCRKCGKIGHFDKVCLSSSSTASSTTTSSSTSSTKHASNIAVLSADTSESTADFKFIECRIAGRNISLLLDLGAKVSILHKSFVFGLRPREIIRPSSIRLKTYTGTPVPTIGVVQLPVQQGTTAVDSFPFHVVHNGRNIMGIDLFNALGYKITSSTGDAINSLESGNRYHLLAKYPELLNTDSKKKLNYFFHKPNIDPNIPPVAEPLHRLPLSMLSKVDDKLIAMESDGILKKVDSSPWVSNAVIVPKANDDIRICLGCKNPNKAIIPDRYPLPTVDELNGLFYGATKFTKIDLKAGYWQVPLHEDSQYVTTMITHRGLYQWTRVPFGLNSAPSCFQKIIRTILEGCPRTTNFIDDIVVAGVGTVDHDRNLDMVLHRLHEYNATINFDKSKFCVDTIDFVGFTISKDGVLPLQSNVDALLKITPPTNIKELHSFLGTANFYLKFVRNFADISEPMRRLLRKDTPWNWTDECQRGFERVKSEIASNRVLAHFDVDSKTIVSTDASGVAVGAVLSQIQHGTERPVAFASRTLNEHERAYSVGEREALACIWACEHWHYYLYGRKFTLRTDHSSLTSLLAASTTGRRPMRLLRWAERLHQYDYDILYRPGKENIVPDFLSRPSSTALPTASTDAESLADHSLISTVFGSSTLHAITPTELADATKADNLLQLIKTFIQKGWSKSKPNSPELRAFYDVKDELTVVDECLFRNFRAIIPASLRSRILELVHEGHCGIVKAKQRARETIWWPGIDHHVEEFIRRCDACIVADKGGRRQLNPPVKPIPFPQKPWSKLALDILGELHGTPAHARYLLVLIDLHSKWPEVRAVTHVTSSTVNLFLSDVFARWGLPEEIITDNGRQFVSREFEEFLSQLGIAHCKTALYHPQANGAVERFNRVLKEGIRAGKSEGKSFDTILRSTLANYRSTVHSTTGTSPAELISGRKMRMPLDLLRLHPHSPSVHFSLPSTSTSSTSTPDSDQSLRAHVSHRQRYYKQYADKRRRTSDRSFQTGDNVRYRIPVRHSKLDPVWSAPFKVISKPSADTARLENGSTWNAVDLKIDESDPPFPQPSDEDSESPPSTKASSHEDDIPPLEDLQTDTPSTLTDDNASTQGEPIPTAPEPLRRSERDRHPPARYKDFVPLSFSKRGGKM